MLQFIQTPLFQSVLVVSALVAVAIPVVFIGIRESTKRQRRVIVDDLSSIFEREGDYGRVAIPSFEFVKYKYKRSFGDECYGGSRDFLIRHWLLGAVPLTLFVFVMNVFSLTA